MTGNIILNSFWEETETIINFGGSDVIVFAIKY